MSQCSVDVLMMRLLIDGDGTRDNRRLNMLLKALIKWCSDKDDQNTTEVQ